MTDSDEKWVPIPGYPYYEASDQGHFRSIDRVVDGHSYRGTELSTRISNRGYVLVDLRDAEGRKRTRSAHTVVLEAFVGPRPRGMEACHGNDISYDNRLVNLRWDNPPANVEDTFRNGRPHAAPKPERHCARCGAVLEPGRGGKRCHACVVEIGEEAATLLRAGVSLEDAAKALDYPHLSGLHQLARVHGGYGLPPAQPSPSVTGRLATLRDRWRRRRGDAQ